MMRLWLMLLVITLLAVTSACLHTDNAAIEGTATSAYNPPPAVEATPSTTPVPSPSSPTETAVPTLTAAPSTTLPPAATIGPAAQPELTPSPTPDPYAGLSIEELAARSYGGGLLEIVDTLEINEQFTRYLVTYPSDGLTIYGFMNVPNEGDDFPVALVLHGYIDPSVYEVLPYTQRYADSLAEAGYFVIHPNFRNYPPSDSGPDPFRIGYAIDILNLIGIIREQSQDPLGTLRRVNEDDIQLWGHSMGGGVALRVLTVNPEPYLRAAVLYGSMSGDEQQNYARIQRWSNGRTGEFELAAPPETLAAISPSEHLERVTAAVSVHHSYEDDVVPVEWSQDLCDDLQMLYESAEIPAAPDCHFYELEPHTFRGAGDALFMERVIRFFDNN